MKRKILLIGVIIFSSTLLLTGCKFGHKKSPQQLMQVHLQTLQNEITELNNQTQFIQQQTKALNSQNEANLAQQKQLLKLHSTSVDQAPDSQQLNATQNVQILQSYAQVLNAYAQVLQAQTEMLQTQLKNTSTQAAQIENEAKAVADHAVTLEAYGTTLRNQIVPPSPAPMANVQTNQLPPAAPQLPTESNNQ